jgi:hypothetical protein
MSVSIPGPWEPSGELISYSRSGSLDLQKLGGDIDISLTVAPLSWTRPPAAPQYTYTHTVFLVHTYSAVDSPDLWLHYYNPQL